MCFCPFFQSVFVSPLCFLVWLSPLYVILSSLSVCLSASLSLCVCLLLFLSVCLSVSACLSLSPLLVRVSVCICLSLFLSLSLSVWLALCQSVSVCLSVSIPSVCQAVYLSVCLCLSGCLSLSACLSVCLCLSLPVSVCLSVCLTPLQTVQPLSPNIKSTVSLASFCQLFSPENLLLLFSDSRTRSAVGLLFYFGFISTPEDIKQHYLPTYPHHLYVKYSGELGR